MKPSEALDKVMKAYVPGVIGYYGKQEPDRWQCIHDSYEKTWKEEGAGERYVARCLELIKAYELIQRKAPPVTPVDAAFIGNEEQVRRLQSRRERTCEKCDSREGIKLCQSEAGITILCGRCQPKW